MSYIYQNKLMDSRQKVSSELFREAKYKAQTGFTQWNEATADYLRDKSVRLGRGTRMNP